MSEAWQIFIAGQAVGLAVWGVWVEIRVRQHDRDIEHLQSHTATALQGLRDDVAYIRQRIDTLADKR